MIGVTKMTTNGKTKNNDVTLRKLFNHQKENQQAMLNNGIYNDYRQRSTHSVPVDDVYLASYHIQHLISEIGEVLEADKRWKNFRNDKYDKEAKLDELADCFIVLMNVAMFSGFDENDLVDAIEKKIDIVSERFGDLMV